MDDIIFEFLLMIGALLLFIILVLPKGKKKDTNVNFLINNEKNQNSMEEVEEEDYRINNQYPVIYKSGHKGIDHYLKMYLKKTELAGTLYLTEDGIYFIGSRTRTKQKFYVPWDQVENSTFEKKGFLIESKWLYLVTSKYGIIDLLTDDSEVISEKIDDYLSSYNRKIAHEKYLEERQIKSRNLDAISPFAFEKLVSNLFEHMGYLVKMTGGVGDEGIDLICSNSMNEIHIVQCKRYKGKVGASIVRDFYGTMINSNAKKGYIVTTGEFTAPAIEWSKNKNIEVIDRRKLAELLDRFNL